MVLSFIRSQLIIFSKLIESPSLGTKNLRQKECYKNVTIWEAFLHTTPFFVAIMQ